MRRRGLCTLAILAGLAATSLPPAANGQAKSEPSRLTSKQIHDLLQREITLKPDVKMTFQDVCDTIRNEVKTPTGEGLRIVFAERAFLDDDETTPPPEEAELKFSKPNSRMSALAALEYAISKIPTRNGALLIRGGVVEITTQRYADPTFLLGHPIMARFEKKPFEEAIEELADRSGATILIDGRVGEKAKTPVSAFFRNTISLEAAVRLLSESADLEVTVQDDVLFVTNRPKVAAVDKNAELRFRDRRLDLALRELAVWSGVSVLLDPVYVPRSSPVRRSTRMPDVFAFVHAQDQIDPLRLEPKQMLVNGTFQPGASAESVSRVLANQVRLTVVNMGDTLYVTSPENAARLLRQKAGKFEE